MDKIKISVPATSANLGSGFDCMGIAFKRYNTFEFEILEKGVEFSGWDERYANTDNLCYVAYKAACDKLEVDSNVKITSVSIDVPVSRGLGSSATLIVAGAVGANRLHGNRLTEDEIFRICTEIEGHPDNIAPAIFGGLCASVVADSIPFTVKYPVSDNVYFTAVVPNFEVLTKEARALIPSMVRREDAIFNMSRAAVLPRAFEKADFDLIKLATQDRLHERYKKKLFKNISDIEARAYECGAVAFLISGAGSTCLCISCDPISKKLNDSIKGLENSWVAIPMYVDNEGAREL
jgi:homoserine kinase